MATTTTTAPSPDQTAATDLRLMERIVFEKGTVIFTEGEPGSMAYVVQTGLVEISRAMPGGQRLVLAEVGPSGIFGEMALIDGKPRSATAVALDDTLCVVIREKQMNERLDRSDPFVRGLVRVLVRNVRNTNTKLR